jgi:hypothetical protein
MFVTLAVFHKPMFALKAVALRNMSIRRSARETGMRPFF